MSNLVKLSGSALKLSYAGKILDISDGSTDRIILDKDGLSLNHTTTIGVGSLATNATTGFVYVPSVAGVPTGVPVTKTGYTPLVYDTNASRLYAYDSGWAAAVPTTVDNPTIISGDDTDAWLRITESDNSVSYSVGIDNSDSDKFKISNSTAPGTNDRFQIDSSGNTAIGSQTTISTNLHVYENNTDTTPAVLIEQDSTGDAALQFLLTGGETFSVGIDNSDSDKFKISDNSSLGTTDRFQIDSSGNTAIGSQTTISTNLHIYENNTDTTPAVLIEQDSTGDAALQFLLTGGETFSMGIDNDDSDSFKISDNSSLGTNDRFKIDSNGNVVVGIVSPATTATDGFLHIPSSAGAPTSTSVTEITGATALTVDETNDALYFYSKSSNIWKRSNQSYTIAVVLHGMDADRAVGERIWGSHDFTTGTSLTAWIPLPTGASSITLLSMSITGDDQASANLVAGNEIRITFYVRYGTEPESGASTVLGTLTNANTQYTVASHPGHSGFVNHTYHVIDNIDYELPGTTNPMISISSTRSAGSTAENAELTGLLVFRVVE